MFKYLIGRVLAGSAVLVGFLLCSGAPAYCQFAVYDVNDPAFLSYWTNETVSTADTDVSTAATDISTAKTLIQDTETAYQTLEEIKSYGNLLAHPQNLQSFTNAVVTINNQNPTAVGSAVANMLVCSQTSGGSPTCSTADQNLQALGVPGGVSSIPISGIADLLNAQGESLSAVGGLQALQGLMDGSVAQTSATTQQTVLQAAEYMADRADTYQAEVTLPAFHDTVQGTMCQSTVSPGGGFCVPGLKDYSATNNL